MCSDRCTYGPPTSDGLSMSFNITVLAWPTTDLRRTCCNVRVGANMFLLGQLFFKTFFLICCRLQMIIGSLPLRGVVWPLCHDRAPKQEFKSSGMLVQQLATSRGMTRLSGLNHPISGNSCLHMVEIPRKPGAARGGGHGPAPTHGATELS